MWHVGRKKVDVIEGKEVQLYCFPSGKSEQQQQRLKAWIAKVKTVRRDQFTVNKSTRLCSLHFVNCNPKMKGSVPDHMVLTRPPSVMAQPRQIPTRKNLSEVCTSSDSVSDAQHQSNVDSTVTNDIDTVDNNVKI